MGAAHPPRGPRIRRLAPLLLLPPLLGGCAEAPQPQPLPEEVLLRRGQSRIDGDVTVTVTALNPAEARRLLGFEVSDADIQPVWVKVRADSKCQRVMGSG